MDALLLTPEEAAQALAICRARVYELMRAGELGSIQIGASRRVPRQSLRAFIEQKMSATP